MLNFFYTLFIFPIEQVIELCYVFSIRILRSPGLSIIALSMVVSTLVLPFYFMVEKQQKAEREKQSRMKRMKDNINVVFKGDKRFMMLSTLYRQHNYHPLYALRNSFDLFIQIPFFIAAYHFFSNLEMLNGQAFKFINDLGVPDSLLKGINILPILMTLINIISGAIYTKGLALRDKIQVFGIAAVFLLLLYNSPSALVLYWTCNNLYNLAKNILQKTKNAQKIVYTLVLFIAGNMVLYLLFFHEGSVKKRLFVVTLIVMVLLLSVWKRIWLFLKQKIGTPPPLNQNFYFSVIGLFLLIGLVIPSSLIASDVEEFSFLAPFSSPLPYLGITLLQSAGILLWLVCIYFLFGRQIRILLTVVATIAFFSFMLNVFIFTGNYSTMTTDLHFDNFKSASGNEKFINIVAMQIVVITILLLLFLGKTKILFSLQIITTAALLCFGISNVIKINEEFRNKITKVYSNFEKIYTFSKTGKNVLIIVLDGFTSGFLPFILEEKPQLANSFAGFIYYPNTLTFALGTQYGMPAIFGGYYYTPLEMQKRKDEQYKDQRTESQQILPIIMAKSGFSVSVYDQDRSVIDLSIYNDVDIKINAKRTLGQYTEFFLNKNKNIQGKDYFKILSLNLIRFSFFKAFPLIFRGIIYDNGNYLSIAESVTDLNVYSRNTIDDYASMYFLSEITEINEEKINYATMFVNPLPHHPGILEVPEYKPSGNIVNLGEGPFVADAYYHVNMASLLLLEKWFDFLKQNGVYDNTRIIIVSDHGLAHIPFYPHNLLMPNNRNYLSQYNPLLMVKDFNMNFMLKSDNNFMSIADVPHLATAGFFDKLINPFTGRELVIEKEKGIFIPFGDFWSPETNNRIIQTGRLSFNSWLQIHTNIFDPENWNELTIEE